MKFSPILAVDVDCTVVEIQKKWLAYLNSLVDESKKVSSEEVEGTYNYMKFFPSISENDGFRRFWNASDVYDDMEPITGSVEFIERMRNELGYKVVFVSHIEGNHGKSKHEFLKRFFEFDAFVATREKMFVRCDIIIDDRLKNLVGHPDNVCTVHFDLGHDQCTSCTTDFVMRQWDTSLIDELHTKVLTENAYL